MKVSRLKQIIREEFKKLINEGFADPEIRKLAQMKGLDRGRWSNFFRSFANTHDIAWDKIPKGAMTKTTNMNDPLAKDGLAFWVINGLKDNPFAADQWDRRLGVQGRDSVLAVTLNGKIQYYGNKGVGSKGHSRYSSSAHDAIGVGKRGTYMVKKLKELADEISSHVDFECTYKPDYRQDIANTWPISIDDEAARNDWKWEPKFDITKMTEEMIINLRRLNE